MDNSDADWRTTLRRGDEPLTRRDVAADLALRRAIGRIGVMRQKSKDGGAFHNLQYTKGGRHHVKYVPEAQLAYPPRPKAELPKAGASAVHTRRRRRTTGGSCRSSTSTSN